MRWEARSANSKEQSNSKISNDQSKFKKDASKEGSRGSMSSKKGCSLLMLNLLFDVGGRIQDQDQQPSNEQSKSKNQNES